MSKRSKRLPISTTCRNCGTKTVGRYCHYCGQSLFEGRGQTLGSLVYNVLELAFAIDAKAPRTAVALLFRPGLLSDHYRNGQIVRYAHPVKMFWMITIFFVAMLVTTMERVHNKDTDKNKQKEQTADSTAVTSATPADKILDLSAAAIERQWSDSTTRPGDAQGALNDIKKAKKEVEAKTEKKKQQGLVGDLDEDSDDQISFEQVLRAVSTYAPFISFMYIPVMALITWLLFRRKRYFYMYHMVFTLHFHTFLMLYLGLILGFTLIFPEPHLPKWVGTVLLLLPWVYFVEAIRRFYQVRILTAVGKSISITILYGILLITVIVFISIGIVAYLAATGKVN